MLNSKMFLNALAALAIASVTTTLTAEKAGAYVCMGQYAMSTGISTSQSQAGSIAKSKWTSWVKGKLGLSWSVWDIAKNKSVICKKRRGRGTRGKTFYTCVAKANPCNYVVK